MRKCCQSPRHLVEILLLFFLVAHVDLFEQSSNPPERNIKWPKTEHKMAKNGWKLSKVAITGSTRSLLAKNGRWWVLANQIRPTTLSAAICFWVYPFLAKKHGELPFLAIALFFNVKTTRFFFEQEILYLQPVIPPKRFDIFLLTGGCSEGLDAFRF